MAQMHERDKPTFYEIVKQDGTVVDTVAKSLVLKRKARLELELNCNLTIRLKENT